MAHGHYRQRRLDASDAALAPHDPAGDAEAAVVGDAAPAASVQSRLLRRVLAGFGAPRLRFVLPSGERVEPAAECLGEVRIRRRSVLLGMLLEPELGFGDSYARGDLDIAGDLFEVLCELLRCRSRGGRTAGKRRWFGLAHRAGRNSRGRSRRNIHSHYDLGNDFYALWLDPELVYTCAYYADPGMSLEAAQRAKLEHVCRKLELRPGQRVIELGCGWGALALYMARTRGARVRAFNISEAQIAFARERAEREGLSDRVEFVLDDYRSAAGEHDAVVSVGMLEHVGPDCYPELGRLISRLLVRGGRGLLHSVGRNVAEPPNAWLERRIFPGSNPPSLAQAMRIFEAGGLGVIDLENLRPHYALTLREWLRRFDAAEETIRERFDERFRRAWRLYLAGCAAGFATGGVQLFQWTYSHGDDEHVPLTREHLYRDPLPA